MKPQCRVTFKNLSNSFKNINASDLLNNLENLAFMKPEQLTKFSSVDSLLIAKALSNQATGELSQLIAKALAANIPATADVTDIPAIASSVPLQCFQKSDNILKLAQSVGSMDLENMNSFRKGYLANKVKFTKLNLRYINLFISLEHKIAESKNSTAVVALLTSSTDPVLINSISTSMIKNLSIDITNISVAQLPIAYVF